MLHASALQNVLRCVGITCQTTEILFVVALAEAMHPITPITARMPVIPIVG
jgi:hypothetical protein